MRTERSNDIGAVIIKHSSKPLIFSLANSDLLPDLSPLQCHGQSTNLWPTKRRVLRKQGRTCTAPQSDTVPSPWSLFWILAPLLCGWLFVPFSLSRA